MSCKEWYCTAFLKQKRYYSGAGPLSVHPGYRHPLGGGGGLLHGLLHTFHAFIHVVVDENHIKEVSICGQNGVRLFLDHQQVFRLRGNTQRVSRCRMVLKWLKCIQIKILHLGRCVGRSDEHHQRCKVSRPQDFQGLHVEERKKRILLASFTLLQYLTSFKTQTSYHYFHFGSSTTAPNFFFNFFFSINNLRGL